MISNCSSRHCRTPGNPGAGQGRVNPGRMVSTSLAVGHGGTPAFPPLLPYIAAIPQFLSI